MRKLIITIVSIILCYNLLAQSTGIIPTPQNVTFKAGHYAWTTDAQLYFDSSIQGTKLIIEEYEQLRGAKANVVTNDKKRGSIRFYLVPQLPVPKNVEQAYSIEISENEIVVKATTETGIFYGWQSLKQMFRYQFRQYLTKQASFNIPCVSITDYPLLEYRGWMDDISRGPIPSMDFIKKQITTLSEFKLNFFTLYTENTFKTNTYPELAPQDALTASEVRELEAFAAQYHVQLVGNQQCFAHMEKILRNPFFSQLADTKYNLNPGNPNTYSFLKDILKEEVDCYSSPLFNINCDETESLGTGKAADYIKETGVAEAYYRHIDSLHHILSQYNKRIMMWGDIALKHKDIREQLPKDIIMLIWSYVPADDFTDMITPFREAGFDFMVASGVSMWSTVFPSMSSYVKNIANLARDGYNAGAMGLLNTAWDDSGESLFNSAWHALAWGAEMSWNPIVSEDVNASRQEREERLATFDMNFNYQFFHYYNSDFTIVHYLSLVSDFEYSPVAEIYQFGSLWNSDPLQFLPSDLQPEAESNNNNETFKAVRVLEQLKTLLKESSYFDNSEIVYSALYASSRIYVNLLINKLRFNLYNYYNSPQDADKAYIKVCINDLLTILNNLKNDYIKLWEAENRSYWRDVNLEKYNHLAEYLQSIEQQVFIETNLSKEKKVEVTLRTIFDDFSIYYTTDGSEPDKNSTIYDKPFPIDKSCVVKAKTFDSYGREVANEKYILSHKGIGALKKLNSAYSTYRATYSGGGDMALLDGLVGSNNYRDGRWQGYQGVDADVEIDFRKMVNLNSITVRFLQNYYDWILAPEDIEVLTSVDGVTYKPFRQAHFDIEQLSGNRIGTHRLSELNLTTQYLRIIVKNPGVLPVGHSGAGSDSFIFLDELIIE